MPTQNSKFHTIKDGVITLHSKHLGDVVEVHVNKDKRRFYGIREDGTKIEYGRDYGNDFAQPVMLYKIFYCFKNDTWKMGYQTKDTKETKWMSGFKTAREAWLYRETLIANGIAQR